MFYSAQSTTALFEGVVSRFRANRTDYSTNFAVDNQALLQGSYNQRIAFLADTDYGVFRSREVTRIEAEAGLYLKTVPAGARRRADDSIATLPGPADYYVARDRVIRAVFANSGNREALFDALDELRRIGSSFGVAHAAAIMQYRYVQGYETVRRDTVVVPVGALMRGGGVYTNTPVTITRNIEYKPFERFYNDYFAQVILGLAYLPGWSELREQDCMACVEFADALSSWDRGVLIDSLDKAAYAFRATGDLANAEAARAFAVFLDKRFADQLAEFQGAEADPDKKRAFENAANAQAFMNGIPPADRALLPPPILHLAQQLSSEDFLRWRRQNPVTIQYDPAFGWKFLDMAILNAADFFGPIYRTGMRIISAGTALVTWNSDNLQTRNWLATDQIRAAIAGDPRANPNVVQNISWNPGSVAFDLGVTALTLAAPVSPGASGLQQISTITALSVTTSMSMALVDSSNLPDSLKGPLQFVVGVSVGLLTPGAVSRWFPKGPTLVPALTNRLAEVTQRIKEIRATANSTPALIAELNSLRTEGGQLVQRLQQLRRMGPTNLAQLERDHRSAVKAVADAEKRMRVPGISPAERAVIRNGDLRAANATLAQRTRDLARAYNQIEQAAARAFQTVGFGSTDLSRAAIAYRRTNSIGSGRNVAVFEYRAADGSLKTVARASERNVNHAERLVWEDLQKLGVKPSDVTRIYSELQPCNLPGAYCEGFILRTFTNARVSYSFQYGNTQASRRNGLAALRQALELLGL